ncbi:uncharacterized protein BJ212DRAFT_1301316 [Suillus subaureus]|uniref:DUF6534 domain-containing protein n=1 Tax=Suillus subaureus TaxID=48587 RepID=A0A9P7E6P7_9AGAM|nr:uncharacterized protein BJ212DRAFT_1301316 [Suillus subaureus]KAG1812834.1 hypothetical protein BJ212DRAFT_1301316 [Suillus subaureus]
MTVNPNNTLGALQVGGSIMVFLFGIDTLQTYYYFKRYPNDRLWIKLLVVWIWLEEIGHTVSVLSGMYLLTVTQFGQPDALAVTTMPTGYAWSIVFSGSVGSIVEAFFAHRMYVLSKSWYLPSIAWTLASFRFCGSMVAAAKVFGNISLDVFSTKWRWLITACFATGAGADLIVAGGLCYYIHREKRVAMGQTTMRILDRLLAYTVETGLVLSMSAVVILIIWGTTPHSCENFVQIIWWFGIFLFYTEGNNSILITLQALIPRSLVFANSLMASLNTRRVHEDVAGGTVISLPRNAQIRSADRSIGSRVQNFMRDPSKSEYDMDIERYELSHEISTDSSGYTGDQFQRQAFLETFALNTIGCPIAPFLHAAGAGQNLPLSPYDLSIFVAERSAFRLLCLLVQGDPGVYIFQIRSKQFEVDTAPCYFYPMQWSMMENVCYFKGQFNAQVWDPESSPGRPFETRKTW